MAASQLEQEEPYLSLQQLAERLNVSVSTVRSWRAHGQGPRAMKLGRQVRFTIDSVREWEQARLDPPR
ncbi:AlpA family transcriptional regulator [Arthrobacter sp. N199823]|uniref:helix-turn-helix transcriptional regulator n=1 Tax=unclassified Arthrobacter TaxID=235627 RepID=UPI000CE30949|nr:helix-turn-helix domain-containing protein [Arthrobacter sp. N199823]